MSARVHLCDNCGDFKYEIDFKDDKQFINCTYEYQNDQISKEKDLIPLALTAIRRLEKLSSVNKNLAIEATSSGFPTLFIGCALAIPSAINLLLRIF